MHKRNVMQIVTYSEAIAPIFFYWDGPKWSVRSQDLYGQIIGDEGLTILFVLFTFRKDALFKSYTLVLLIFLL